MANPDSFTATVNQTLTVNGVSGGVLQNDTVYDDSSGMSVSGSSGSLTASQVSGPSHGTLSLNPDGTFAYTPDAGFVGSDAFTYAAAVGEVSATASVTLNVGSASGNTGGSTGGTNGSTGYGSAGGTSGSMPYSSGGGGGTGGGGPIIDYFTNGGTGGGAGGSVGGSTGGGTGGGGPIIDYFTNGSTGGSSGGTVGIFAVVAATAEGSSTPGEFKITRSNATGSLTVAYEVSGTATGGVDYAALGGSVTFAAGVTEIVLPVYSTSDSEDDLNETVVVNLVSVSDPVKYTFGTYPATVTITQPNSPPTLENLHFTLTSLAYGTGSGTLTGWLYDGSQMSSYSLQFDHKPDDGVITIDGTAWVGGPNAEFTTTIYSIPVGTTKINVRASELDMNGAVVHGEWTTVTVNAINTPPVFNDPAPVLNYGPLIPPAPGSGSLAYRPRFTATVAENSTDLILTVAAHDNDPGDYVQHYRLTNDPTGAFVITDQYGQDNKLMGQITLSHGLDYEQLTANDGPPVVTFVVCADDTNGGTTEADVIITVTDMREMSFNLPENATVGTFIGDVRPAGYSLRVDDLEYAIVGGNERGWIRVGNEGGLFVDGPLDFETAQTFSAKIEIANNLHDGDPNRYFETLMVTVHVTNTTDDDQMSAGDTRAYAWEGGKLQFFLAPNLIAGAYTKFEVDVDGDGAYDAQSTDYSGLSHGGFVLNVDQLSLLGTNPDDGTYTARYRATTASGQVFEDDVDIIVRDVPPAIHVDPALSAKATQSFTISVSTQDRGPDTVERIEIDWGDGTGLQTFASSGGDFTHTYSSAGDYLVEVRAYDEDNRMGYLAWEQHVDYAPSPAFTTYFAVRDDVTGIVTLTVNANTSDGSTPVFEWDLNGDGVFGDTPPENGNVARLSENPYWSVDPIPAGAEHHYRARVRVTEDSGGFTVGYFDFIAGPGFVGQGVQPTVEQKPYQVIERVPPGFNINIAMEIVDSLRPDVAAFVRQQGVIFDMADTGGYLDYLSFDVYSYYYNVAGGQKFYVRLNTRFSAGEAANGIIDAVENGFFKEYFQASRIFTGQTADPHLKSAHKALGGVDDFTVVDNFGKWQKWYAKEAARTGVQGYEVVSSWYTLQFSGAEFVMTAKDVLTDGVNWTHALDAIQLLPWLGKLNIPITLKNPDGTVAATIQRSSAGLRVTAGAVSRDASHVFGRFQEFVPQVQRTLVGQAQNNTCVKASLEMVLNDLKVPNADWNLMRITHPLGHSLQETYDMLKNALKGTSHSPIEAGLSNLQLDFRQLKDIVARSKQPTLAFTRAVDGTSHAVVVDALRVVNGVEFLEVRDPWSAKYLLIPVTEFKAKFTGSAVYFPYW